MIKIALCRLRWFKLKKMSKRCQVVIKMSNVK